MIFEPIRVEGLKEFSRALKRLDTEAPKALRVTLNTVSSFIINKVRPLIPRKTGRAANSLKPRSTQNAVRIGAGGRSAPYYPWLDFGGSVGPNKRSHRPFYSDGRYLYPTYHKHKDDVQDELSAGIVKAAEDAGLEVT